MKLHTDLSTTNSYSRRHIRFLVKDVTLNRDLTTWDKFARETDRHLIHQIRNSKRRKKREHVYIPATNHRLVRLQSKTGFFLRILPTGKVDGHTNKTKYSKLELQVISPHVKRIKSVATGYYLAINGKGKVTSKKRSDPDTYFYEEVLENMSYLYSSIKYPKMKTTLPWYLGLKRKNGHLLQGRTKRASRTLPGDAATHFYMFYED